MDLRFELKMHEEDEDKSKWVVWVSALTGIIGAITGLVAVLSKTS